jgi:glutathione synthase/RimK-type ligase-like ATP-grasp enzyme
MRRRLRIGLVTYSSLAQLTASDQLTIPMFGERGLIAEPVVWSDPSVQWQDYSLVVLRSAWDSHLDPVAFYRWLDHLADLGVKTLNPLGLVRQNQHKFYLRSLEERGIRIIPTRFIDRADRLDLSAVRDGGWAKAVIKPAISANSYSTELFDVGDFRRVEQKYQGIARERDLLVQEFMPEIQRFGEISLVFINRRYSHAILKSARQADFRVQAEYGGQARYFRAHRAVVAAAAEVLRQFSGDILYARVDGVVRDKEFYLMEIELTDPELYFDHCPDARERFVEATVELSGPYVGR